MLLALTGCAHESKITPSQGHIDGQQTSKSANIPKPVKSTAFVPKPTAKAKEQTYSVVVNEVPVKEVLFALARESKLNIDINPAIQGRVTLNAVDQTLPAILERLAKQVDLTYKLENNVLSIAPDYPVLRTYKIDYVNVARDTKSSIGVAAEISSTGQAASTDAGGASSSSSSGGGSSNNSSRTTVDNESKSHFWETLEKNLKDILAETDKEVLITRAAGSAQSQPTTAQTAQPAQQGAAAAPQPAAANASTRAQELEAARTEYKTLFAATVIVNKEAGVINIRATNRQHEKVQEFLDKVLSSAKRQVLIEATIVEVVLNDTYQFGIDWNVVAGDFTFTQLLAPSALRFIPNASNPSNQFAMGVSTDNLTALLHALETFGNAHVLSSPKMMALNNQTAILKVVDNLVYFTIVQDVAAGNTNTNNAVATTSTPHTVPVGVVMSVTPQISDTGAVTLIVRPTISRESGPRVPDPVNPTSLIPEIQVREMESILQVDSGQTVVLGGLMQDNIQKSTQAVPVISKIPFFGRLFESNNDSNKKSELVIFLRPTIISNASLESDELKSFKQYLPTHQLQQTIDEPVN